jgi:hypothetical protein
MQNLGRVFAWNKRAERIRSVFLAQTKSFQILLYSFLGHSLRGAFSNLILFTANGDMPVKHVLQMVFEQSYYAWLLEFCYVVGKGKRGIKDNFNPDYNCVRALEGMERTE